MFTGVFLYRPGGSSGEGTIIQVKSQVTSGPCLGNMCLYMRAWNNDYLTVEGSCPFLGSTDQMLSLKTK